MPAVLIAVPTVAQNSLCPLSMSSTTARRLLDCMLQGKVTEADAATVCLDITPSDYRCPCLHHLPILCGVPFVLQPSQFILAWDGHRIMLACIPSVWVQTTRIKQRIAKTSRT